MRANSKGRARNHQEKNKSSDANGMIDDGNRNRNKRQRVMKLKGVCAKKVSLCIRHVSEKGEVIKEAQRSPIGDREQSSCTFQK